MTFNFPIFSAFIATILVYVPHVIRVKIATEAGKYDNKDPRNNDALQQMTAKDRDLQRRLLGAHQNQIETIGMYVAAIVANIARGNEGWLTNMLAALYIGLRIAYIAAYAGPPIANGYLRSLLFFGCFSVILSLWITACI